ncbi:MAG: Ezrin/radixin/moesin family protein [Cytophagales bacterium]|nr:MAG: Ezrin/radixin/moesin family protein [Cytophagales bacterium]
MKSAIQKIVYSLIFLHSLISISQEDKKEWEKKKKELDPMELKRILEENTSLKSDLAAKKNSISELETVNAQKSEELAKTKEEFTNYKNSINTATAPERNATDATTTTPEKKELLTKGVIFKVQIGAFKNKDLRKYFENNKNFSGDVDDDGVKKYTLGYFNDYWEAETFKKYLREMGVKDAWIVPYKNGKRVNIRDVLEGLI